MDALTALALRHGSDKGEPHGYTAQYARQFAHLRDSPIGLLEIGIGGYEDPRAGGPSLKMWRDYFPLARIAALDLHDKSAHAADRVRIYQGSQDDPALLARIHRELGGLDIVIDDGSHVSRHVIASFATLFPLLNVGGIYVVEDTQTSYWPRFGGSSRDPDSPRTTMGFFKSLVHGLNHAEINGVEGEPDDLARRVVAIQFSRNMVFVHKGDNTRPSTFPPTSPLRSEGEPVG